jgi:hypothetical protein
MKQRHRTEQAGMAGAYVDTPNGIFTASGHWFRTTEELLHRYAAPVLEREPLAKLLRDAEVWLRSPQTMALWALPLLLAAVSPGLAAAGALALYVVWRVVAPGVVNRLLGAVLRVLDSVLLQALYYVFVLSLLGARGAPVAVAVGLAGFVALRWGLVDRLVEPLVRAAWTRLYRHSVPDRVLRSVILGAALRHHLPMPEFDRMERDILAHFQRSK